MADIDIPVTLDDDMQAAIRAARDVVAPSVADADLVPLIQQWALDGIEDGLVKAIPAQLIAQARQAANPVVAQVRAAFAEPDPEPEA